MDENIAPSYFIENMIYNCPAPCFNGSYQDITLKILQNVLNDAENGSIEYYKCANGQDLLFLSKNGRNIENAKTFIFKCANLVLEKI